MQLSTGLWPLLRSYQRGKIRRSRLPRFCDTLYLQMKALLISGTSSGVGKTTLTLAIAAALRKRGQVVQPLKCGPDYLDTSHHSLICERPCRNLDSIMLSLDENRASLAHAASGADLLLAEGMMGLFDGLSGSTSQGSSAEIAMALGLPVILVLDGSHTSRSLAATLLGFCNFEKDLPIAGVILNRIASEGHFKMIAEAIANSSNTPILGWIPKGKAPVIPERHLGLHQASEVLWSAAKIDELAAFAESHLDMDRLLGLAADFSLPEINQPAHCPPTDLRIGIARDEAFSFYYEDNFDLLRQAGAELVPFSPLHDAQLPAQLDAIYLGGGYPELHAEALEANTTMQESIRNFAHAGLPIYAECGGMMYLGAQLRTQDRTYKFAGLLPLEIEMSPRLVKFGYVECTQQCDTILGPAGQKAIGHSFHYSRIHATGEAQTAYQLNYIRSGRSEEEGFTKHNILASYVHLHFRSNRALASNFAASARRLKAQLAPSS